MLSKDEKGPFALEGLEKAVVQTAGMVRSLEKKLERLRAECDRLKAELAEAHARHEIDVQALRNVLAREKAEREAHAQTKAKLSEVKRELGISVDAIEAIRVRERVASEAAQKELHRRMVKEGQRAERAEAALAIEAKSALLCNDALAAERLEVARLRDVICGLRERLNSWAAMNDHERREKKTPTFLNPHTVLTWIKNEDAQ